MLSDSNKSVVNILALVWLGYVIGTNSELIPFIVPIELLLVISALTWLIDTVVRKLKKKA